MPLVWDVLYLLQLTAIIWVPLIALSYLSQHYTRLLGYRTTVSLGIVGVPLHELGHLIMAVLMNHKIVNFALFKPSIDGSLGYVSHSYKVSWFAPFANLLIGLAPLVTGVMGFIFITIWLRPDLVESIYVIRLNVFSLTDLLHAMTLFLGALLADGGLLKTLAWMVMSLSILLFCVPSKADFYGCRSGILTLLCSALVGLWFFPEAIMHAISLMEPYTVLIGSVLWSILVLMSFMIGVFLLIRFIVKSKIQAVQG